jgi:uncharacterized protein YecT (DUF1311 family)
MADFTGCYTTALSEAEEELARILGEVRTQFAGSPADLSALAAAQSTWTAFVEADCAAVAARWSGKPQQAVRAAHCQVTQALRRAQALWVRELNADNAEVPADCLP